jgi:short-subunit dehydrogenase
MGLAAAKFMPKEKIIVISGRTVSKLENAVREAGGSLGYTAYAHACDTSDRRASAHWQITRRVSALFGT